MKKSILLKKPFSVMLYLFLLSSAIFPHSLSSAEKIAVVFVSQKFGGDWSWDHIIASPRVAYEINYLRSLGYKVYVNRGNVKIILQALTDPKVRAISYFGHAAYPSMEDLDASSWRQKVFQSLFQNYSQQGLLPAEAFQRADSESKNFGLELVRNHSCNSLANTSIAHQFVKAGGFYYGVSGKYVPCPSPFALFSDVSFFLDEYKVPVVDLSGTLIETLTVPNYKPEKVINRTALEKGR